MARVTPAGVAESADAAVSNTAAYGLPGHQFVHEMDRFGPR